jgi:ParB-like chromosome segregation protein Spo0J
MATLPPMSSLRVADILAALPADHQRHLYPLQVERYRHSIDRLLPVVVFETEEGLLLADGHHRLAAAVAEGKETIEAEVRHGSRHDALAYAVAVGAAQRGISTDEVMKHVRERTFW